MRCVEAPVGGLTTTKRVGGRWTGVMRSPTPSTQALCP